MKGKKRKKMQKIKRKKEKGITGGKKDHKRGSPSR